MSRYTSSIVIMLMIISAAVLIAAWRFKPYFWLRSRSAQVQLNGTILPGARVYKNSKDYVLISLGSPDQVYYYVVRTRPSEVAVTTSRYFWFVSSLGALAKGVPDPSINITHEKFNYKNPQLTISDESAAFEGLDGKRITIRWPK